LTENARFAREQIDILADYVRPPWDSLDWHFIHRHSAQLLAHTEEVLLQEKRRKDLPNTEYH